MLSLSLFSLSLSLSLPSQAVDWWETLPPPSWAPSWPVVWALPRLTLRTPPGLHPPPPLTPAPHRSGSPTHMRVRERWPTLIVACS